jgi:hypothetical protein
MSKDPFKKFLESEAKKNPLRIEGYVNEEELKKDVKRLAKSMSREDYKAVKEHWRTRSFASIAVVLRKYGLEFKGITYMERLVSELTAMMENK